MFIGSAFQQVGGADDFTYGDLKTDCNEEEPSIEGWQANADSIIQLTATGSFSKRLVYLPFWMADELECEIGWYDEEDIGEEKFDKNYNQEQIKFGTAIQISVNNRANLTFAGEVKKTPTITPLTGVMGIVNCAPAPLRLADIKTDCNEEEPSIKGWQANADSIILLTKTGSFERRLVYLPFWMADELECEIGWYDEEDIGEEKFDNPYTNKLSWDAGVGFQVSVNSTAKIQIDPAITDDEE